MSLLLFSFFDDGLYSTLTRSGAFWDLTNDWTRMTWVRFDTETFVDGDDFTAWELRTDASLARIRVFATNVLGVFSLCVEVTLGGIVLLSATTPCAENTWFMVGLRYTAAMTTLDVFVNEDLLLSETVDLSGFPVPEVDSFLQGTGPSDITVRGCRDLAWQSALSAAAIAVQLGSVQAIASVATLLADTPLTSKDDLLDRTGNGRDWMLDGTAISVGGPKAMIGAAA